MKTWIRISLALAAAAEGRIEDARRLLEQALKLDPDCQFHVVEDGGHWVAYERADEFNRVLAGMLRRP